ncbi:hypothetical protein G5V59_17880 [Nocardioides sp. W3-2-3]|nr:hypothetical protein [Nocardioides convexus]
MVIDVAMTETARCADFVLPAASQFEKWEASLFTLHFPHNVFQAPRTAHVAPARHPAGGGDLHRGAGPARRGRAAGARPNHDRRPDRPGGLRAGLLRDRARATGPARADAVPALPDAGPHPRGGQGGDGDGLGAGAPRRHRPPRGAGAGGLRRGRLPQGPGALRRHPGAARRGHLHRRRPRRRVGLRPPRGPALPPRRARACSRSLSRVLAAPAAHTSAEFPLVLSAGERRSFTANVIIRNPQWRRRDADGALRISPRTPRRWA